MSSHILEEVRVLHPQQLPRHSVFTIETLLRRVNDIGKSLALQKMNKTCKQLNPLSLDQSLYLPNYRIPDEAYSLQFYFCPYTASSDLHWYKVSTGPYILLVHLLSHLEP